MNAVEHIPAVPVQIQSVCSEWISDGHMAAAGVDDAAKAGKPVGEYRRARDDYALNQALHTPALRAGEIRRGRPFSSV
jgi:hypothetical protein